MKIISWNINKSKIDSASFHYLKKINADVLLLQEVVALPLWIKENFTVFESRCVTKNMTPQRFNNVIAVKGGSYKFWSLVSEYSWVNQIKQKMSGNLQTVTITLGGQQLNIINLHSPAWKLPNEGLSEYVYQTIKLRQHPDIYLTEILFDLLKSQSQFENPTIVAGDFNSSETFDWMWGTTPRGNREIIDRLESIGFKECLRYFRGSLTPTFKNRTGGKVIHQLDHVYVDDVLLNSLTDCQVGSVDEIFGERLSDHLPIICTFK